MLVFICRERAKVSTSRNSSRNSPSLGPSFCPDGMLTDFLLHMVCVHQGQELLSDTLGWCLRKAAIVKGSHVENKEILFDENQ